MVLWNGATHWNAFRMHWFCNLPIWIISQQILHVLFVYTPIHFKVCLVTKKVSKLSIIENAITVHKNLPSGKISFFQLLSNLQFVGVITKIMLQQSCVLLSEKCDEEAYRWRDVCGATSITAHCFLQISVARRLFFFLTTWTDVATLVSQNVFTHLLIVIHDGTELCLWKIAMFEIYWNRKIDWLKDSIMPKISIIIKKILK